MAWQGVPFRFVADTVDSLSLAVSKLPDVVLKSNPDYTTVIISGVVALITGILPAGMAIYTFSKNSKIIKEERLAQQLFLKAERQEQQAFLKKEREAQADSMEKDRKTQKEIAERNFNKEVLSVNRQAWINHLREQLSEYMALMPELLRVKFNQCIFFEEHSKALHQSQKAFMPPDEAEKANQRLLASVPKLKESLDALNAKLEKNRLLTANIKLMLNPSEEWYPQITSVFASVDICYNSLNRPDQELFERNYIIILEKRDELVNCSQKLLKYEWERVKKGE
ncbi:hypothetical protein [Escherichia coli]|uniref:hypothetical protein n=1 Tax=Escherichia coli TaxID=562 RepID=UPI001482B445|nr:hypothetical protein [Escherichia coli]NNS63411.1 hypothetical protein [Escherichia coli]NNS91262.1 hypothetical protein [Escherichia coli]NNS96101.1 hypothetical protein [Escherichia coli]NNT11529.1 hypothetical protein [Escherichia coli]NNT30073.1 hypothetical protein [Escherichia coli]